MARRIPRRGRREPAEDGAGSIGKDDASLAFPRQHLLAPRAMRHVPGPAPHLCSAAGIARN